MSNLSLLLLFKLSKIYFSCLWGSVWTIRFWAYSTCVTEAFATTPSFHRAHHSPLILPALWCCLLWPQLQCKVAGASRASVPIPQATQHHRLPLRWSCPGQAAVGEGRGENEGPSRWFCSPTWSRTTAASACSCCGIHHPGRGEQPTAWAEQGGFLCAQGQEGGQVGSPFARGTATGRGAHQGTRPTAPAVQVACTEAVCRCVCRDGHSGKSWERGRQVTAVWAAGPPHLVLCLSFFVG